MGVNNTTNHYTSDLSGPLWGIFFMLSLIAGSLIAISVKI